MCVKRDILAALAYFDLFDYPLTQSEIFVFLRNPCTHEEFISSLQQLTSENHVIRFDEFYTLQENYTLVTRRNDGNLRARKMLETAQKIASLLSAFPFVRGVAVSGSLSKNFADENSDIDFFIITAKNRLWLARTFMHCFKKITFLFKKQDWFCMNYYVDEEMLQIKEKNIYTAIEVATLLPLRGIKAFKSFYADNEWCKEFLPNHGMKISYLQEGRQPIFKKIVELFFNNKPGELLDSMLMKITAHRWAIKTERMQLNSRGCILGMDTNKHYAKNRPENFQNKLIANYETKLYSLFRSYDNKIQNFY
ncbi:MAG: nucleotidyltransferase domain-containing protein [Flavisolibacter sp.]